MLLIYAVKYKLIIIYYKTNRALGSIWPSIYFCLVVIIGNFIILKLFLAVMIFNFG